MYSDQDRTSPQQPQRGTEHDPAIARSSQQSSMQTGAEHSPSGPAANGLAQPPVKRKRREASFGEAFSRFLWLFGTAALVAVVWKVGPQIVHSYQYALTSGKIRAEYENAVRLLQDEPLVNVSYAYQLVAQKVRPSVVSVRTRRSDSHGQGSGVVMSRDGYILTNAHVVDEAEEIRVSMYDRHRYTAKLVGTDPHSDLAVLKIDAPDLIPASWGNSDEMDVGSIVWAIGSPYGLDQTVTSGIISGKHRQSEDNRTRELLQTDAAVNPGNSGGPLVDAAGRVIGINTSIFGDSFQGISFAVPSETVLFVYRQLIEKGYVSRGYLGVRPGAVFQGTASRMKLPNLDGAQIQEVIYQTPAHKAGLRPGDVILEWDGKPIKVHSMLFRYVEMTPPNVSVPVKLVRNGLEKTVNVRVESYARQDVRGELPSFRGPKR